MRFAGSYLRVSHELVLDRLWLDPSPKFACLSLKHGGSGNSGVWGDNCVSYSHGCEKTLDGDNLREEGFI